jgi:hypothetical protein
MTDDLPEGDDIIDLMEESYKQLLRDMSSAKEGVDGAPGSSSSPSMTIADRVRILTSVREFLNWKQKLKPEKATSGIAQLRDQLSVVQPAGRARRGS